MTENKNTSPLVKRAEQLKRWEDSDTNKHSPEPRPPGRIRFASGIEFLAACAAGDKEEVQRLLKLGTDINTANIDGLTALHQACIDDNLEMVEFLVLNGADVNRGDNEGWTPLHATASCGFLSIGRYLLDNNANITAVNYDGQLPIDIADNQDMIKLLQDVITAGAIDCSVYRNAEYNMLLEHARGWAENGYEEIRDPKTGGTPLHVAAAKGYFSVAKLLLDCCHVDPNRTDFEGWTPLHAAALWGQKTVASLLLSFGADPYIKNDAGHTCLDVADPSMVSWLHEELVKPRTTKYCTSQKRKLSPPKRDVKRVDIESPNPVPNDEDMNPKQEITTKPEQYRPPATRARSPDRDLSDENANAEAGPSWRRPSSIKTRRREPTFDPLSSSTEMPDVTLKRTQSFESDRSFYQRYRDVTARIKASSCSSIPPLPQATLAEIELRKKSRESNIANEITNDDVQTSKNKLQEKTSVRAIFRNKDNQEDGQPIVPTNAQQRKVTINVPAEANENEISLQNNNTNSSSSVNHGTKPTSCSSESVDTNSSNSTPSTTTPTKLSPGNIFKNFFKTFGYSARDEESETQRKAHAKRVRETRRSTQGVTLEDVRSAEQLLKKKAANGTDDCATTSAGAMTTPTTTPGNAKTNSARGPGDVAVTVALARATATATATVAANGERRPSWRLRLDPANKFDLEETTHHFARRSLSFESPPKNNVEPTRANNIEPARPNSVEFATTYHQRRPSATSVKTNDDNTATGGEETQESTPESKHPSATMNIIQRRRRPKRRSTGVGRAEVEEAVNDNAANDDADTDPTEASGGEGENAQDLDSNDYKILYQASLKEIRRLDTLLTTAQQDLREARATIVHLNTLNDGSQSETEKREKRAMERKLSEMEEELKQLQKLKAENERLRAENRALTRVVSKLTNSAAK